MYFYLHVEMSLRITALTPWTVRQGAPLKELLIMRSKARKVVCGPGVYSHGFGNIVCFCSLPVKIALDFCLALTLFEKKFSQKKWLLALFRQRDCSRKISFTLDLASIRVSRTFFLRKYEMVLKT